MNKLQKIKYASFGSGLLLVILAVVLSIMKIGSISSALFLAGLICAILPYGLFIYFQQRKLDNLEKNFPLFLRDVAESIKSSLSLPQAFKDASNRSYGRLTPYIVKSSNQLSWGVPFPEVIERLIKKMEGSNLIQRSLTLVLQAYNSGGNISKTLDTLARDVTSIKEAEEKRNATLHQQVVVIYIIFFVFVIIIVTLYKLGIARMLGANLSSMSGLFGGNVNMCTLGIAKPFCNLCPIFNFGSSGDTLCYYKVIFMFMILVQGIFNGLVAGQVGTGKAIKGLKHSFIMAFIGLLIYLLLV